MTEFDKKLLRQIVENKIKKHRKQIDIIVTIILFPFLLLLIIFEQLGNFAEWLSYKMGKKYQLMRELCLNKYRAKLCKKFTRKIVQ